MRIYNPGNAFCICQNTERSATFLVDPWIAKKAYADGWIPPVYTKDINKLIKKLGTIDFVLITHIHEDHLDKEFLRHFANKGTKIIFPRVFGWRYMKNIAQKIDIEDQLYIIDFHETINLSNFNIQAVPPMNTDCVNDTDKIGDNPLSIDSGFIVTDKYKKKVAFMADNNPYNSNEVKKLFQTLGKINLFCMAHSGFASDYPFHYGYNREDCLKKYKTLEKRRQEKQLNNIKSVIKPNAILAYSSSFLPNSWVDKSWWSCAEESKYFNAESAASEFEKASSIKSFGLNKDLFLDLVEMKKLSVFQDSYFADISSVIHDSLTNPKLAQKYTVACNIHANKIDLNYNELVDNAKKNFHAKADKYGLSPLYEVRLLIDNGKNILLKRGSNLEDHVLDVRLSEATLMQIISGNLHWDSAMLSFLLNYKREPDSYCQETYNALLNFSSTT